ncbi:GIY-YIG nuclease family protein [Bradyrhizobium sp. 27S5]
MGIYIYMLRCADNSYYVGSATGDDLRPRIEQHNAGTFPGYTYNRRPVVLVWSEYFDRVTDGIAAERQIKGWGRAKKEALIKSDWKPSADWRIVAVAHRELNPWPMIPPRHPEVRALASLEGSTAPLWPRANRCTPRYPGRASFETRARARSSG